MSQPTDDGQLRRTAVITTGKNRATTTDRAGARTQRLTSSVEREVAFTIDGNSARVSVYSACGGV